MHIFLQGKPGVGKSTLIHRFLTEYDISPSGFFSKGGKENSNEIYLFSATDKIQIEKNENRIGIRRKGLMGPMGFPEAFDTEGVEILRSAGAPLIVMDEIGFMENEALAYQKRILELLNAEVPILGVVKEKTTPFINEIISHQRSIILQVSEANRDQVWREINNILLPYFCHSFSI